MQITTLEYSDLEVIKVYRSEQGSSSELLDHLKNGMPTVICGDFNICYSSNRNNKITKRLEDNEFIQLMKEATHLKGRHLDHFYFHPGKIISKEHSIYRYSPYYSDHDAICATISTTHN